MNIGNRNIRALIFDLDGTLYFQKPVQTHMFIELLKYFVVHFWRWRQLYGIYYFRKIRENDQFRAMSYEQQLMYVSKRIRINHRELEEGIRYWMFQVPLCFIEKYKDEKILTFLYKEQRSGKKIIIYSDYPVEEKLKCLKIEPDYIFYPGINGIMEMKPSLENMKCISDAVGINAKSMVFIGDRADKDGTSAELVNMPFILVHNATT